MGCAPTKKRPRKPWPPTAGLNCTSRHEKVYDGRVLSGQAHHILAMHSLGSAESWNRTRAAFVVEFGVSLAQHALANKGWYDDHCDAEGGCHSGDGNENMLIGVLPSILVARLLGNTSAAATMTSGVDIAFRFLARNGNEVMAAAGPPYNSTGLMWEPQRDSH